MSDFVDWEKPLPFVKVDDNRKLQINQNTATLLSKINQPAVVVGISGIYRKGKSYLMNRIAKKRKGFPVGHELQTETKGIWIWCLKHPLKSNTVLILLDSEGLDSSHEDNRTQDSQIITLTVLLCSAFLYNVSENIDANTLDKLHFVTELVKRIKLNKSDQEENADTNLVHFSMHFPLFILVIRNFRLKSKLHGRNITSDKYFAEALAPKKDDDKSEASFNQPRRIIRNAFRNRHCFTLPIPYRDTEEEEDLDNLPDDKLAPKFIIQCNEFCQFIYENAPVKKIGLGNIITGHAFVTLCEGYVDKMNSDHHICLEPTTAYVIEKQNEEVKKSCVKIYKDEMNKSTFPISEKDFLDFHNLANDKAMAYLREHIYFDEEGKIFEDIKDLIPKEFIQFKERNDSLSLEKCTKILDDLYEVHLADKISTLYCSGGYQMYQELREKMLEDYNKQTKEEIMTLQSKEIFISKLKIENDSIMMADTAMTKLERTKEQTKQDKESKDRKEKIVHMEKEKESSLRENLTKKYQDDFRKLQKRMEQSEDEFIEEYETIVENRILEKERITREGLADEAEELEYQINELRKIIKLRRNKIIKRRLIIAGILGAAIACGVLIGLVIVSGGAAAATGAAGVGTVAGAAGRETLAKVAEGAVKVVGDIIKNSI